MRIPRIVRHAVRTLGILLFTSYFASALDVWFHASSEAVFITVQSAYTSPDLIQFGKTINDTRCDYYASQVFNLLESDPALQQLCGLLLSTTPESPIALPDTWYSAPEGLRTLSNTSVSNMVVFTDDQHAILVNASNPLDLNYEADTVGVQATCQSITQSCIQTSPLLDGDPVPDVPPVFDCTGSPPVSINNELLAEYGNNTGIIFGVVNQTGYISDRDNIPAFQAARTNPFNLATVVSAPAYANSTTSNGTFAGDTGFYYSFPLSWNVLYCTVSVHDVHYRYAITFSDAPYSSNATSFSGFQTVSYTNSSLRKTMLLATMIDDYQDVTYKTELPTYGVGYESGSFVNVYALQLSKALVGMSASIFEPLEAQNVKRLQQTVGSQVQVLPLVFTLACSVFYCIFAISIAGISFSRARSIAYTRLAHARITAILSFLQPLSTPSRPPNSWKTSELGWFNVESEQDRLNIGTIDTSAAVGSAFGMWKTLEDVVSNSQEVVNRTTTGANHSSTAGRQTAWPQESHSSSLTDENLSDNVHVHEEHLHATGKAIREAQKKGSGFSIFIPVVAVVIALVGPTVLLAIYIFVINEARKEGLVLETTAQLSYIVTISQVISTTMSLAVPIVVSVFAYHLAAGWLRSTRWGPSSNRPSPLQLGFLISLLQGANIFVFVQVTFRLLRLARDRNRPSLSLPSLLKRAIWALGLLLVLSNSAVLTDTWFHASSSGYLMITQHPYSPTESTLLGRQVNVSLCADHTDGSVVESDSFCSLRINSDMEALNTVPEGFRALVNASSSSRVAFTDDQHAILVPASLPPAISYQATTVGVHSSCRSITTQCVDPSTQPQNNGSVPSFSVIPPVFNCTGSPRVVVDAPLLLKYPDYIASIDGTSFFGHNGTTYSNMESLMMAVAETNLIELAAVAHSTQASSGTFENSFLGDTGFFLYSPMAGLGAQGWNILNCNVTVRDIEYEYVDDAGTGAGAYTTRTFSDASPQTRQLLLALASTDMANIGDAIDLYIGGTGMLDGSTSDVYADAYAIELSRQFMAFGASAFLPTPVESISSLRRAVGSRIHLAPFILYLSIVAIFCCVVISIGITSALASRSTDFVHLAHTRITSTLPIIHSLFGPVDAERTWKEDGFALFSQETEADRLRIGPIITGDGETVFGIGRTTTSHLINGEEWEKSTEVHGMSVNSKFEDANVIESVSTSDHVADWDAEAGRRAASPSILELVTLQGAGRRLSTVDYATNTLED